MIKLLKFGTHFGVPDPSPYVLKLETYLRLAKIDYDPVAADVRKAPKSKLPCLIIDDQTIADSHFSILALKEKFGEGLNEGLSASEMAEHHLMRLGLENHTYFLMLVYRWLNDKNAPIIRDTFFGKMGLPGKFIFKMVQRDMRRTTHGQGILRHSWEEIDLLIAEDIQALEAALGDQEFFGGSEPKEIDATTFAFIANMLVPELDSPFRTLSRQSRSLVAYHNRMTEIAFPDYKDSLLIEFKG